MHIQGILFDLDNTLYDYDIAHNAGHQALTGYAGHTLKIPPDVFEQTFRVLKKKQWAMLDTCAAAHSRIVHFQMILEELNLPYSHALPMYDIYWNHFLDNMVLDPGVTEVFSDIKKQGIKLCILTNLTTHIQFRKLTRLGLIDSIDCLITSEEAGFEKPHPHAFIYALYKTGLDKSHTLMVGDSFHNDYEGARTVGMPALWLNRKNCAPPQPGTAFITNIQEVTAYLATGVNLPGVK